MLDALARLLNRLSDQDWTWWPFLRLRPPKERPFTNGDVGKIALAFGPFAGLLVAVLLFVLDVVPGSLEGAARVVALVVGCVVVATIALFVIFRLTFAAAWNRRARQLAK